MNSHENTNGSERFVPEDFGPLPGYEHAHRYLAASLVLGKGRVLDLASGSGAGTAALRAAGSDAPTPTDRKAGALQVIGLDLDLDSARSAAPAVQGDAVRLPFADGSFDGVICFEAIEHLNEPSRLLAEIRRVLRRGGVAILSTPNREVFSARAGRENPFHVSEMNPEELFAVLSSAFAHVALYSQSVWAGSWLSELSDGGAPAPEATTRRWRVAKQDLAPERTDAVAPWSDRQDSQAPVPLYMLAICSTSAKALERARRVLGANHLLHDSAQWLLGHYLASLRGLTERDALVTSHESHGRNLEAERDQLRSQIAALEEHADNVAGLGRIAHKRIVDLEKHAANLEMERAQLGEQISSLEEHAANVVKIDQTVQQQIIGLEEHATNLESERSRLNAQNSALEDHAINLERLDQLARERIAGLEEHTANLESERARLDAQVSALEDHAINIERLDQLARERIAGLEEHTANLESERARLDAQVLALQEHATNVAQLDRLAQERIASLEAHVRNVQVEIEARTHEIADLHEAVVAGDLASKELRAQAEGLRVERDTWQDRADAALRDLAELRRSRAVRFATWLRARFHR